CFIFYGSLLKISFALSCCDRYTVRFKSGCKDMHFLFMLQIFLEKTLCLFLTLEPKTTTYQLLNGVKLI
ncbi:MAG: hypothetical protein PHS01_04870, partial [Dysgonamonadaceae bacterium]|nr:hypothetical protein [Dysgonamonadaceae bacterium]